MSKEIKQVSIEIEHYNGDTYMSFILFLKEDGSVGILNPRNCSLADVDGDYLYNTENNLYRIQAEEPITEDEFDDIWACYNEHN